MYKQLVDKCRGLCKGVLEAREGKVGSYFDIKPIVLRAVQGIDDDSELVQIALDTGALDAARNAGDDFITAREIIEAAIVIDVCFSLMDERKEQLRGRA